MSKLVDMNAGKSLKVLMTEQEVSREKLAFDLGISETTVSTLRRNVLMSGSNIAMLSKYFKLTASDFIRKGEK